MLSHHCIYITDLGSPQLAAQKQCAPETAGFKSVKIRNAEIIVPLFSETAGKRLRGAWPAAVGISIKGQADSSRTITGIAQRSCKNGHRP
jgi:hypothetical protein